MQIDKNLHIKFIDRRLKMKNFVKLIVVAGLVLCFNINSFANIDVAAWGGYVFSGESKVFGNTFDFTGQQFGIKAHYNISLTDSFVLGLGGYYQYGKYTWDLPTDPKFKRKAAGIDVALIFSATPEIFLYLRANYSIYDKFVDIGYDDWDGHGFGVGGGVEYSIIPNLRLFGELMYEMPTYDFNGFDYDKTALAFNIGVKYLFL
jgi:hypothetical protein